MAAASLLTALLFALAIAIATKPVVAQKLPLTLPLIRHLSISNHTIVEGARHRVGSLRRHADDSEPKSTRAYFRVVQYIVPIRIGNGSVYCK